jgi:hypothetical protein
MATSLGGVDDEISTTTREQALKIKEFFLKIAEV